MENAKEVLIKNLKGLRKERGINQEELAEKAGYSIGFIKDIERGKSWLSPEAAEAIAYALDVQLWELFKTDKAPITPSLPVSKTLQKLMSIPDEVYDLAEGFDKNHKVWETVKKAFELEVMIQERAKKKNEA
jgi:transcriptional regulator with XRE-family HTH domain